MSGNPERAGLRAAHDVRSAWIGGFNMAKIPDSDYIAHLQELEIEGKIKYLLDEMKKAEAAIGNLEERCNMLQGILDNSVENSFLMLEQKLEAHLSAHQAIAEAREITGEEAGNILKRLRKDEAKAREAGKCKA